MEVYDFGEYSYPDLVKRALCADATQKDIDTLGEWFQRYGMRDWNSEFFSIDKSNRLFPVYEEQEGDFEVIRYEIR